MEFFHPLYDVYSCKDCFRFKEEEWPKIDKTTSQYLPVDETEMKRLAKL